MAWGCSVRTEALAWTLAGAIIAAFVLGFLAGLVF